MFWLLLRLMFYAYHALVWSVAFVKWLPTPGGAMLVFLFLGSGVALWGLKAQPQGMAGNLVAELAGAFFSAAAVDGVLLFLSKHQRRQGKGALSVKAKELTEGYRIELRNRSSNPIFNVRVLGPYDEWRWSWGDGAVADDAQTFGAQLPFKNQIDDGAGYVLLMRIPETGPFSLPFWMVVEWEDIEGQHFRRRELLHAASPPYF